MDLKTQTQWQNNPFMGLSVSVEKKKKTFKIQKP